MSYIYSDRELKIRRMWSDDPAKSRGLKTLANLEALAVQALADANPRENMPSIYVETEDDRVFEVAFVATLNEISLDEIEDDISDEIIAPVDLDAPAG